MALIKPIPIWALYYLVSADASDLYEEEVNMINDWYNENNVQYVFPVEEDEKLHCYFTSSPEFGCPCDVVDCNVITK